ncbi:MAG: hypothetical protein GY796_36545 [Chloroflexi bacterium]|nr:hypothetical protein [Chloroflexota bacterium]
MFRILFTDNVNPVVLAELKQETDVEFDIAPRPSQDEFRAIVGQYDGIVVRSSVKVDASILTAAKPRVKVVVRAGVGVDNVDISAATENGILIVNTPDAITVTTGEHTIGLLLALARHIPQAYVSMRNGAWDRKKYTGVELAGKTIGLVGLGRIGLYVAKICNAMDMNVIAYDPFIEADFAAQYNVALISLDELLARSEYISLHAVLNDATRKILNAAVIAKMKPGAFIVNTARGALLDEAALTTALQSGHLAGAALDTFTAEPLAADSPLRQMDNVIVTPHLAASTAEAQYHAGALAVKKVLAVLRGDDYGRALNEPAVG